jgi:hypothetical protein
MLAIVHYYPYGHDVLTHAIGHLAHFLGWLI